MVNVLQPLKYRGVVASSPELIWHLKQVEETD